MMAGGAAAHHHRHGHRPNGLWWKGKLWVVIVLPFGLLATYILLQSQRAGGQRQSVRLLAFEPPEEKNEPLQLIDFQLMDQSGDGFIANNVYMPTPEPSDELNEPFNEETETIANPINIEGAATFNKPLEDSISPEEAGFPKELHHFVIRNGGHLELNGQLFYISGFNNYYMLTRAAWIPEGRQQVEEVFQAAKEMGTNTIRINAFADGDHWNALQPRPGVLDEDILRDGLDAVLDIAQKYSIRLIMCLTNYWKSYGGMQQYVKWVDGSSITDFYTNYKIKSMFKDYIYSIVNRRSATTQVRYRDNPVILGWEIANEPRDPGNPGSKHLQSWLEEMSSFIKSIDNNHLVMVGFEGFFGPSTPNKKHFNPYTHVFEPLSNRPYRYDAVCEGADFASNHKKARDLDLAIFHLYPDHWTACDEDCKIEFTKNWIRSHIEVCSSIEMPCLIEELGKQKPIAARNEFFELVHNELMTAIHNNHNVAGSLHWVLAADTYPDYDGFTIYHNNPTAVAQPRPQWPQPYESQDPADQQLRNFDAMMKCLEERAYTSRYKNFSQNEGFEKTTEIISRQSSELAQLANSTWSMKGGFETTAEFVLNQSSQSEKPFNSDRPMEGELEKTTDFISNQSSELSQQFNSDRPMEGEFDKTNQFISNQSGELTQLSNSDSPMEGSPLVEEDDLY